MGTAITAREKEFTFDSESSISDSGYDGMTCAPACPPRIVSEKRPHVCPEGVNDVGLPRKAIIDLAPPAFLV